MLGIKKGNLCMFSSQHLHKDLDHNFEHMFLLVGKQSMEMDILQHKVVQHPTCIQKLYQGNFKDIPIQESHHNIPENIDWRIFGYLDLQRVFLCQDIFQRIFLLLDQHKNQQDIEAHIYQLYFKQTILEDMLLHKDLLYHRQKCFKYSNSLIDRFLLCFHHNNSEDIFEDIYQCEHKSLKANQDKVGRIIL